MSIHQCEYTWVYTWGTHGVRNDVNTHFYEKLSRDLSLALNKKKGFSPTNLKYAKYFYNLYSPMFPNLRQDAEELENANRPQLVDKSVEANRQQVADDFEMLFNIPWIHQLNKTD